MALQRQDGFILAVLCGERKRNVKSKIEEMDTRKEGRKKRYPLLSGVIGKDVEQLEEGLVLRIIQRDSDLLKKQVGKGLGGILGGNGLEIHPELQPTREGLQDVLVINGQRLGAGMNHFGGQIQKVRLGQVAHRGGVRVHVNRQGIEIEDLVQNPRGFVDESGLPILVGGEDRDAPEGHSHRKGVLRITLGVLKPHVHLPDLDLEIINDLGHQLRCEISIFGLSGLYHQQRENSTKE